MQLNISEISLLRARVIIKDIGDPLASNIVIEDFLLIMMH